MKLLNFFNEKKQTEKKQEKPLRQFYQDVRIILILHSDKYAAKIHLLIAYHLKNPNKLAQLFPLQIQGNLHGVESHFGVTSERNLWYMLIQQKKSQNHIPASANKALKKVKISLDTWEPL